MVACVAADNVAAVAVEDNSAGVAVDERVAAVVDNGKVAAAAVALAAGVDIHRQTQLVVARRHASNLCPPGSVDAHRPPGPAEQPTWPSSEAWSSTDRQSQFRSLRWRVVSAPGPTSPGCCAASTD